MDYEFRQTVLGDWFVDGIHRGARYMIVVFDLMEQEERPVFVFPEQNIHIEIKKQMNNTAIVLKGVVDLLGDAEKQLSAINTPNIILTSRVVN